MEVLSVKSSLMFGSPYNKDKFRRHKLILTWPPNNITSTLTSENKELETSWKSYVMANMDWIGTWK